MFTKNIGTIDRIIRAGIGVAIIGAGVIFKSWWGLIGIIPLGTASVGFCGLYKILGTATRESEQ